ncbi:low molecular weight phosphatase family protein [Aestuariivivens sediminicola]|uniref:arsenate-mycothiol transferase ArsC n=1 Tax=Aestuariivivens sediminicola TaxID=2913560 RepID=UPI001F59D7C1|nr:protein-tyrosine-phosphatase [Aestuariivivens sediminicola]
MIPTKTDLFPKIKETIENIRVQGIGEDRKMILQPLIDFIQNKVNQNQAIRINFICTHNSRRSHFSQVWAQTLAYYFKINTVFCYSGGTEATALFPMVAETLGNQGYAIQKLSETNNPVYAIKFAENEHPIIGFSKKMDHEFNPKSEFAAIMTCDSANEACPFVPGAEQRVPVTFEDPKAFDNTPQQAQKYLERSIQIATELYYVFSQIESKK